MKKIFLLTTILAGSLFSATFNVSTTPELRTALSTASTNGENDTIILADGTYKTTDDGEGTFVFLNQDCKNISLRGSDDNETFLDGNSTNRVIEFLGECQSNIHIEKLSIQNGNGNNSGAAGIYSTHDISITSSTINNNINAFVGGIQAKNIIIRNSKILNNIGDNTGGVYTEYSKNFEIYDSNISNNKATSTHTGSNATGGLKNVDKVFNCYFESNEVSTTNANAAVSATTIENSYFINNKGPQSSYTGTGNLYNSIVKDNDNIGFAGNSINSLFINNSTGLKLWDDVSIGNIFIDNQTAIQTLGSATIKNTFFSNETYDIFNGSDSSFPTVLFSNLNSEKVMGSFVENYHTIYTTLGFVDEDNGDYHLTPTSDLIDAGTTTIEGLNLPTTDLDGKARIVGASIDIGPYEFSTTRPTINSFTYTGNTQELNELTFTTNYTLTDGRYINSVSYDFENNETWTTSNTHTYNTAGTYTVKVKITDSEGEFSIQSKEIIITELDFASMTNEQKLIKAIDSQYYDEIIAIISDKESTSTSSGITTGENNVTSDPSSYNLITKAQSDSLVSLSQTSGYNDGLIAGKQYAQDNLAEFNLVTTTTRDADVQAATTSGITTGKQYVQDNLTEFNLITKTASDIAIASAITTGQANVTANPSTFGLITIADKDTAVSSAVEQGKQIVLSSPSSFGLELKEPLTKAKIDALSSGWHNISSPSEIMDLTIFDNASIVWIFNSTSNSWEAYSSNSTYIKQIENDSTIKLATKINAAAGIWVLK
ncbi:MULTISPECIES: PKD domain-containing protein [Arcobacteraceae]|uniref:PKD domain-containing protein n=1 Tax=Poseidonibacter parvus TaxID=1850254 RepID=A0A1P8KMZ3_9BACT|nr:MULTISPECIES: PKD domain-containing protein [Arcobacteraceae]APW65940.1 hypothetical protein LPB137_08755 [Poseidonibacter parvus]